MQLLVDLPEELITLIATELDSQDFFNFRRICREINTKSFSHLLHHYFQTRYVMLDRCSLENLLQISSHTIFGPSLHTLEICVDHLTDEPPLFNPGTWYCDLEHELATVNEAEYKRYLDDQIYLKESGLDAAYLTQALVNLPNCKTIVIDDLNQPWGAASQKRQTGVSPTSKVLTADSICFVKRALRVILAAVIASRLSLEEFHISFGFNRHAISPAMLVLPEICSDQLRSRLTSLNTLVLTINPDLGKESYRFYHTFPESGTT
jgi:hypothetical protein